MLKLLNQTQIDIKEGREEGIILLSGMVWIFSLILNSKQIFIFIHSASENLASLVHIRACIFYCSPSKITSHW
jgi:hypothetical protein